MAELFTVATRIVPSPQANNQLVVQVLASPVGDPLGTNLVNVGSLTTQVGMGLAYYGAELEQLAPAGLTHDLRISTMAPSLVT